MTGTAYGATVVALCFSISAGTCFSGDLACFVDVCQVFVDLSIAIIVGIVAFFVGIWAFPALACAPLRIASAELGSGFADACALERFAAFGTAWYGFSVSITGTFCAGSALAVDAVIDLPVAIVIAVVATVVGFFFGCDGSGAGTPFVVGTGLRTGFADTFSFGATRTIVTGSGLSVLAVWTGWYAIVVAVAGFIEATIAIEVLAGRT